MTPTRQWARLFLPVAIGVVLASVATARLQYQTRLQELRAEQSRGLALADQDLSRRLLDAALDLRVVAGSPALLAYLERPEPDQRAQLQRLMQVFVDQKRAFERFTLYQPQDLLQVRRGVTYRGGVSADASQAGWNRALAVTADLPAGSIQVSGFELLEDRDGPVRPHQPALYLSIRLQTAGAEQVLQAQLRGAVLLKHLRDILASDAVDTWLLDQDGYWLSHPDPQYQWGRQIDPTRRLDRVAPRLAARLDQDQGQVRDEGALLVFRRLGLAPAAAAEAGLALPGPLLAIQRVPPEQLPSPLPLLPLGAGALLLMLWAAASAGLVRMRLQATRAERQSQELLQASQRATQEQVRIRERIYQLGLSINAAPDLRRFGEVFLAQIAPSLAMVAGCLYYVEQQRCLLVASFGLAPDATPREFAFGQGLVGEVARTHEVRRMTPPPPGYLDLRSGLGSTPPAELRVLPLWVHEHCFGVLELACARVLDSRQETLLQELSPVLALNLAGRGAPASHSGGPGR